MEPLRAATLSRWQEATRSQGKAGGFWLFDGPRGPVDPVLETDQVTARDAFLEASLCIAAKGRTPVPFGWTTQGELLAVAPATGVVLLSPASHDARRWQVIAPSLDDFLDAVIRHRGLPPLVRAPSSPPLQLDARLIAALDQLDGVRQTAHAGWRFRPPAPPSAVLELGRHHGGSVLPELAGLLARFDGVLRGAAPLFDEAKNGPGAHDRLLGTGDILREDWRFLDALDDRLFEHGVHEGDAMPVAWTRDGRLLVLVKAEDGSTGIVGVEASQPAAQWPVYFAGLAELIEAFVSPRGLGGLRVRSRDFPFARGAWMVEVDASQAGENSADETDEFVSSFSGFAKPEKDAVAG